MQIGLGIGMGIALNGGGASGPAIVLSATSISEAATSGTTIGALSVVNHPSGSSGWTYVITTQTPASKTAISTANLNTAAALSYNTNATLSVTITASKSAQTDIVRTFTIYVLAVLGNLALSSYAWTPGTPSSGSITGAHDANEVITLGSGWPSGLTINSAARTWAYDGTGTDSSGTGSLIGTHPQATNSPHVTSGLGWTLSSEVLTPAITKVAIEGDSLSTDGYAPQNWCVHAGVTYHNFAVGGSTLPGIIARIATVIAYAPDCLLLRIGTNGMFDYATAQDFVDAVFDDYCTPIKTALPNCLIFIGGTPPKANQADPDDPDVIAFNARRAEVNDIYRDSVGDGIIDGFVPVGQHPQTAYDLAPQTVEEGGTGDYPDGLHPGYATQTNTNEFETYKAVLDPIMAQAGLPAETEPDSFAWTDVAAAPLSTPSSSGVQVTGLGLHQFTDAAVVSGAGTIARGYTATGAGPISDVVSGDVITATLMSSASHSAMVSSLYSIGDKSDTFNVTTVGLTPAVVTGDAMFRDTSTTLVKTFSGTCAGDGRMIFAINQNTASAVLPTGCTVSFDGAAAQACELVISDTGNIAFGVAGSVWVTPHEGASGDSWEIVATWTGTPVTSLFCQVMYFSNSLGADLKSSSILGYTYYSSGISPETPGVVTVAAGDVGMTFAFMQQAGTNYYGQTLVNRSNPLTTNWGITTTFTSSLTPKFDIAQFGDTWIYGLAFGT